MIQSFKHKGLAELFKTGNGKPAGRYAVWVDENFRVTFRFEAKHAVEVDYGDYH
jgi:plasmid maintenance system killer protein